MKPRSRIVKFVTLASALAVGACSTVKQLQVEEAPAPVAAPVVPAYVQVPHPLGTDTGDLRALFQEQGAPSLESLEKCDADQRKLVAVTPIEDERQQGVRELVRQDPVGYHWCYYGKLLELENKLRADSYVDERQKAVLDAFSFLTPVSRAFLAEFHDSRYLRWGVAYYRRTSEWVFFRKLELSPQGTSELVEAATPYGLYRDPAAPRPVLDKYRISVNAIAPNASIAAAPVATAPSEPAAVDAEPEAVEAVVPQEAVPEATTAEVPSTAVPATEAAAPAAPAPATPAPAAPAPVAEQVPKMERAPASVPAPASVQAATPAAAEVPATSK